MDSNSSNNPLAALEATGALMTGHFELTSGRHSDRYFQGMKLLQHPAWASAAARSVLAALRLEGITATVAPAVGGIVWGYALAAEIPGCRALFTERVNGTMTLRRGFAIQPGERVLLAEDVVTTGGSVSEVRMVVEAAGGIPVGLTAVLDRSGGAYSPGIPFAAWASISIASWTPDDCPLCAEGAVPAIKPGSRSLI